MSNQKRKLQGLKVKLLKKLNVSVLNDAFLDEITFRKKIIHERTRSERTLNKISIVTIDLKSMIENNVTDKNLLRKYIPLLKDVFNNLINTIRETDYTGWFMHCECIGILFTDISSGCEQILVNKIEQIFIGHKEFSQDTVKIQISVFPLVTAGENPGILKTFYPEIRTLENSIKTSVKRCIDIAGSLSALITFTPLFIILMILIKVTSPGPVFYCQQRIGKDGKIFSIYKFRSMRTGVNDSIHREYVTRLIQGNVEEKQTAYKIVDDPRVTAVGRVLRKTSLDELPQFLNVFLGTMSLVGPRPPIGYETKHYKPWHLKRIFEVKPGITGIWQVEGRSATTFDGMVRMDLKYARHVSATVDLKLILKTFFVFFTAKGGY